MLVYKEDSILLIAYTADLEHKPWIGTFQFYFQWLGCRTVGVSSRLVLCSLEELK
jgi:hypothetical protein